MKPGDLVRWTFIQGDGQRKPRPAIVLATVPPFHDLLICAVSSQIHREVKGLDLIIDPKHPDYQRMGLRFPSLIRVAQLVTLPNRSVQGVIGSVSPETLEQLRSRLREWLK